LAIIVTTIASITDHLKQKVDLFLDSVLDPYCSHDKMNYICTYLEVEDNTESSVDVLDVWAIAVANLSRRKDRGVGGLDSHFIVMDSSFTAESSRLYCCFKMIKINIYHKYNLSQKYATNIVKQQGT
jgi:hypothetical protein